jgi:hypothetical protein
MPLKRNYKGIDGYFYQTGNKKMTVVPGIIDKAWYSNEWGRKILNLGISKDTYTSFVFELEDKKDIESILENFEVKTIKDLNALPKDDLLVLTYSHNGTNYGISLHNSRGNYRGRVRI